MHFMISKERWSQVAVIELLCLHLFGGPEWKLQEMLEQLVSRFKTGVSQISSRTLSIYDVIHWNQYSEIVWSVCVTALCFYTHNYRVLCYAVFLCFATCVLLTCLLFPPVRIYLRTLRNIMFPFHLLLMLKICMRLQIKELTLTILLHHLLRRDQHLQQIQTLYPKLRYVWCIVYNCIHLWCICFCGIYKQGSHGRAIARGPYAWELVLDCQLVLKYAVYSKIVHVVPDMDRFFVST